MGYPEKTLMAFPEGVISGFSCLLPLLTAPSKPFLIPEPNSLRGTAGENMGSTLSPVNSCLDSHLVPIPQLGALDWVVSCLPHGESGGDMQVGGPAPTSGGQENLLLESLFLPSPKTPRHLGPAQGPSSSLTWPVLLLALEP